MIYKKTVFEPQLRIEVVVPVKKLYQFAGYLFVASVIVAAFLHVTPV